ncbi:MAG: DUF1848 domain-containing protein [Alphaproteobacteria bacterium]|nr:DUF1848 domain-containing protein [Alphaproteobacteria bacterium]
MILSASYKTDIPAFYGPWFANRLTAGFCRMVNPYGGQIYTVPLTSEAVDGFVFWTRNIAPFLETLTEVRARGFPFVVQYTVTGYPHAIETSVIKAERSVALIHELADVFGPRVVVWRYDPILFTSLTPPESHIDRFASLAQALAGAVDEVVVSFAHIYRKTERNLTAAARAGQFSWTDPEAAVKQALLTSLAGIAAANGLRMSLCAQAPLLVPGVAAARCIDVPRLSAIAGHAIAARAKPHRPCGCAQSRDIGDYDTCPHGCVYCYAVTSRTIAHQRYHAHDPEGEFLFKPGRTA